MTEPIAITPVLPQIQTIVMLMLENRSLDTLLGWLYNEKIPNHFFPPNPDPAQARYNGIPPAAQRVSGHFLLPGKRHGAHAPAAPGAAL